MVGGTKMRFGILWGRDPLRDDISLRGEHSAMRILTDSLREVGDEVFYICPDVEEVTELRGVTLYPMDKIENFELSSDFIITRGSVNEHQSLIENWYKEKYDDILKISNRVLLFLWAADSYCYKNRDKNVEGIFVYEYSSPEFPHSGETIPDIPFWRWHPWIDDSRNWNPEKTNNNILYRPIFSNDHIRTSHALLDAWKDGLSNRCKEWTIDIIYGNYIIYNDNIRSWFPSVDDVSKVRILSTMNREDYLDYAVNSSLYLCPWYNAAGKGVIEPAFMGVPSILCEHSSLPDGTAFTTERKDNNYQYFYDLYNDWLPKFYDHLVLNKEDPEIAKHIIDTKKKLHDVHSKENSIRELNLAREDLKNILEDGNRETYEIRYTTLEDEYDYFIHAPSEINELLSIINKICEETETKTILELGIGSFRSSTIFLNYINSVEDSYLTSVDIESSLVDQINSKANKYNLQDKQTAICSNSLTLEWSKEVDLLFIDTEHTTEHVWNELNKYSSFAKKAILVHDAMSIEVYTAIRNFLIGREYQYKLVLYPWNCGLAVLYPVKDTTKL